MNCFPEANADNSNNLRHPLSVSCIVQYNIPLKRKIKLLYQCNVTCTNRKEVNLLQNFVEYSFIVIFFNSVIYLTSKWKSEMAECEQLQHYIWAYSNLVTPSVTSLVSTLPGLSNISG